MCRRVTPWSLSSFAQVHVTEDRYASFDQLSIIYYSYVHSLLLYFVFKKLARGLTFILAAWVVQDWARDWHVFSALPPPPPLPLQNKCSRMFGSLWFVSATATWATSALHRSITRIRYLVYMYDDSGGRKWTWSILTAYRHPPILAVRWLTAVALFRPDTLYSFLQRQKYGKSVMNGEQ
jgi:hypothetical protein